MVWVGIGVLIVCAVAFYVAAELAPAVGRTSHSGDIALGVAAILFPATIYVLVKVSPPGEGFVKLLAVAIPGIAGLACLWFVKEHIDKKYNLAGFIAGVLGVTMFAISFLVMVGKFDKVEPITLTGAPANTEAVDKSIDGQIKRFSAQKRELEMRIATQIPRFRSKLRSDADAVKRDMARADAVTKVTLEEEVKDIAKLMLALNKEESATQQLIVRVNQEIRRLERLRASQETLGDDAQLAEDLDRTWKEAGAQLSRPLDERLGTDTMSDIEIQAEMDKLLTGGS